MQGEEAVLALLEFRAQERAAERAAEAAAAAAASGEAGPVEPPNPHPVPGETGSEAQGAGGELGMMVKK